MTSPFDVRGLWVPVITPFTPDDEVDAAALARLAARLLMEGADGLVALGTTGEPATLAATEQRRVVDICAAVCLDRDRPLIVGCGGNDTRATVESVHAWAQAAPTAAAFLVVVPYYTRPSEAGIVEHFKIVARESAAPVIVYNIPYRTGRGLGAASLLELASVANVAGVKQAVGAIDHDTIELLARRPDGFAVLAGDDAYITPTILMGGAGAIAAAAHVLTGRFARMIADALDGHVDRARTIAHTLMRVVRAGFAEPNPAVWKAALHAVGEISTPMLRMPMTQASEGACSSLLAAIANCDHGEQQLARTSRTGSDLGR
jgi:4-hydroxy-tetrahydrodipicolinate synthase